MYAMGSHDEELAEMVYDKDVWDQVSGEFVHLHEGWHCDGADIVHRGRNLRIVVTGRFGRWKLQQKQRGVWTSIRRPGNKRISYFRSIEKALDFAWELFPEVRL